MREKSIYTDPEMTQMIELAMTTKPAEGKKL